MPNYNNADYVAEAIESIQNQTYKDWHLYISDDGSTDTSVSVITNAIKDDERITLVQEPSNIGNPANRNALLELAKHHELLAILDSDDIAKPERLEQQVAFFDANTDIDLVGSYIEIIDEHGVTQGIREYPTTHESIRKSLLVFDPFAQPSVMFRSNILQTVQGYDERLVRCQDYDFFIRMIKDGRLTANIPEPLTQFRIFSGQGKYQNMSRAFLYSFKVRSRYLFTKEFFSLKGIAMWVGYGGASLASKILPAKFFSKIFSRLFIKKI